METKTTEYPARLTWPQYKRLTQRKQAAYIKTERKRYKKADKLWLAYREAMHGKLNLHPLNGQEILDRFRQLDGMERDIKTSHGDNMRPWYDACYDAEGNRRPE